jgi:hypothetical protein
MFVEKIGGGGISGAAKLAIIPWSLQGEMAAMTRRTIPHLVVLLLLLILGGAGWLLHVRSAAPESRRDPTTPLPSAQETKPTVPASSPSGPETSEPVIDPVAYLLGELIVRVVSLDDKPIAGAKIFSSLKDGPLQGEEGVPVERLHGGGIWHQLGGKPPAFSGNRVTDSDGVVRLRMAIPRQEKYLKTFISLHVEAEGYVDQGNYGQLRLPREGERKEITFLLQAGQVIRGKVLNLQGDDHEHLWIVVCHPDEEKEEKKSWVDLPEASTDGSFQSKFAPSIPLLLIVKDHLEKYLPYRQILHPPFNRIIEVVLQRNPDFEERGRAIFSITNPPASGKLDHTIRLYSEARKEMLGDISNHLETSPVKRVLQAGAYHALLMSLDQEPVWASARFTVTDGATTEVPLTLGKAGTVRLSLRERASGRVPAGKPLSMDIHYQFGEIYQYVIGQGIGWGKTKTATEGEFLFVNMPPGSLKLTIGGGFERRYKECARTFTLAAGQEQLVEFLLEAPDSQDQ